MGVGVIARPVVLGVFVAVAANDAQFLVEVSFMAEPPTLSNKSFTWRVVEYMDDWSTAFAEGAV